MSATTENPKVFISYSWTSVEHEQFVMDLATSLRNHGVDAILDKWDLKPGQDKYVFMESMVVDTEVLKVLVFCDRKYQEKANNRAGGVGTESQIISQELYGRVKQTKFIPIVCEYDDDGQPCLPVFMKGLIYIDVSSEERLRRRYKLRQGVGRSGPRHSRRQAQPTGARDALRERRPYRAQ